MSLLYSSGPHPRLVLGEGVEGPRIDLPVSPAQFAALLDLLGSGEGLTIARIQAALALLWADALTSAAGPALHEARQVAEEELWRQEGLPWAEGEPRYEP